MMGSEMNAVTCRYARQARVELGIPVDALCDIG